MPTACAVRLRYLVLASLGPWVGSDQSLIAFVAVLALTPIPPPFIDLGVDEFNVESFGSQRRSDRGFCADADNQARERLVLAFVFTAFGFWRALFSLLIS